MWATILSLVLGAVPGIVKEIANAKVQLANAETEQEKVAAEERVKALEAKRDVLVSESRAPWDHIARLCFVAPTAFFYAYTLVWDKIMHKWFYGVDSSTDKLGDWQWYLMVMIVGFYFLGDITKLVKR